MYKVELLDYQLSELTAKYIKYIHRWDLKEWLTHLLNKKDENYRLFKYQVEGLIYKYVKEVQRLQICGILYGPCNQKMIDKYLWGVDEFGASVNPDFMKRFAAIVDEYKGKGE
jgi:hypothetical protein